MAFAGDLELTLLGRVEIQLLDLDQEEESMDGVGKHNEHGNLELVEMGEWARDILMEKLGSLGNAKGVPAPPPILQSAKSRQRACNERPVFRGLGLLRWG